MTKAAFEHARRALDFLERHQLEPSPGHYELALAYFTSPASPLGREVVAATDGGLRLTHEKAAELAATYLSPDATSAVASRERTVTRQAEELGALTSGAHDLTSALERDVGSIMAQSEEWPPATEHFVNRLSDAERDLADLRAEVAKLQRQIGDADHPRGDTDRDEMTQALNQRGAREILENLADFDRGYVLILFSLDDLNLLNRRFGRPVGDNVLNALAGTLRQVFPDQELIRWSGNEFVVVMKDTALIAARAAAQDALTAMEARRLKLRGSGEGIGIVTASAGIAVGQRAAAMVVLEQARVRAVSAAAAGGNRYED